ncbi:hypothetical protein TSUD_28720 [Trifolium subterraneum]|uniref:RNase H type-1 domain-containing protein n=1 Tax=Trifolium subterraneum TaxID=3900 RepID=A0A2Z6P471_TRISU|nr:hypothetical protein TSUD_28720 [Trifolium subterraneum]
MNKAYLLKLSWKLHIGATDFWCNVLRGKYVFNNLHADITSKNSDSSLWKAISKLVPCLYEHGSWIVGDGKNVPAWTAAWLEPGLCLNDQNLAIPADWVNAKVGDLVTDNGDWNWQVLRNLMPSEILHKFAASLPPNDAYGKDEFIVAGADASNFSVAAMYSILCNHDSSLMDAAWIKIWKLGVPERVRTLVWLLTHDRLLTNYNKHRMGLGTALCSFCRDIETALHVFRDCPKAMQVWLNVVLQEARQKFFHEDLSGWINYNLDYCWSGNNGVRWSNFWAMGCHRLWQWRNQEVHSDDFQWPQRPVQHISSAIYEYSQAKMAGSDIVNKVHGVRLIGWKPPDIGVVKLNTDGACKDDRTAGCGGIIRNSDGRWIDGFAKSLGKCNSYVAELWEVLEGLKYARRLGYQAINLNVDSLAVKQVLTSGSSNNLLG